MVYQAKKQLRKKIKNRISTLTAFDRMRQSAAVFQKFGEMQIYSDAKSIMLFWSFGKELFTHDFVEKTFYTKEVLLPVIQGSHLLIKPYNGIEHMVAEPNYGILEPKGTAVSNPKPDIIVVPGLAFDAACNRLGRGKAYYDKLFGSFEMDAKLVGVGYNEQIVESVPVDGHDHSLDMVITPENTYYKNY